MQAGLTRVRGWFRTLRWRRWLVGIGSVLALLLLALAMFPVGLSRSWISHNLSGRFGAPVSIGSIERTSWFSFSPTIVIRDLRMAQPSWAGPGDFARVGELRLRVPLLPALIGRGLTPQGVEARGLMLALVRTDLHHSNWKGRSGGSGGGGSPLTDLVITDGRFTLRDAPRHLALSGTLSADHKAGLRIHGVGIFHDAPADLQLEGPPVVSSASARPYPVRLRFSSPLLELTAQGTTARPLDFAHTTLDMHARGGSLKYLDNIIQAGLFGTQPIDLTAHVRHDGHDWLVDRIAGSVGRSRLTGHATIRKRDGRSKIDADLDFAQFDFDDLADDAGRARGEALEARIGERVLPNVRVNLAKVGPTDGVIRFTARKLLFEHESVLHSLKGVVRLEGKTLTLDEIDAGLTNGRLTGRMLVDHRQGASPLVTLDLQLRDARLGTLVDAPDKVDAPIGARILLTGRGDTIRDALSGADGHVGLVAGNGFVARIAAAVLAQDMGKTIGAALSDKGETVPLRCIALGFEARGGTLTAGPFLIETDTARSRGEGSIDLHDERIALTIGGRARDPSGLPMVDPIRIGGTLSAPDLQLSDVGGGKGGVGSILGAVVKSIGGALGLTEKKGPAVNATGPVDCEAVSAHVLRGP